MLMREYLCIVLKNGTHQRKILKIITNRIILVFRSHPALASMKFLESVINPYEDLTSLVILRVSPLSEVTYRSIVKCDFFAARSGGPATIANQ